MRKLATIRVIDEIRPIPNADNLELAIIGGWECVVAKKKNFKAGDKVIYVEVDSILPEKPEFEFLRSRRFRVKTIKLRGQISQGLVLPLTYLANINVNVDDDVTEVLGIKKYDPQAAKETRETYSQCPTNKYVKRLLKYKWFRKLYRKYSKPSRFTFPEWISKTDETRVQNLAKEYASWLQRGLPFYVTEKVDGQSATYAIDEKKRYYVGSRNWILRKDMSTTYWQCSEKYRMKKLLLTIRKILRADRVVIQGEILAPKVQGNKYAKQSPELYVYNIIVDGVAKDYDAQVKLLTQCGATCRIVPLVFDNYKLPQTIHELVGLSSGVSMLAPIEREGFVIRNYQEDISFKCINPHFLLKNDD